MPGKVNPVIPEVVNQVAYQVIGNDLTVTMAAEAGQLQLNVMEPVLAFNCFQSLKMLIQAVNTLTHRCIKGITANRERCRDYVANSIGIVTALVPHIGYENSPRGSPKKRLETNQSVMDLVLEEGLLSQSQLEDILSPQKMTQPRLSNPREFTDEKRQSQDPEGEPPPNSLGLRELLQTPQQTDGGVNETGIHNFTCNPMAGFTRR
jgi:aspartate ammonia-lyase